MRVLLLSPYASTATGVGAFVARLGNRLRADGHAVLTDVPPPPTAPGTGNLRLALRSVRAVWRHRAGLDVLHCQQLHPQSAAAGVFARAIGVGVVTTVHGRSPPPRGLRGAAFRLAERVALRAAHRPVFVAASLRDAFREGTVVPNGVAADEVARAGGVRSEIRAELGLGDAFALLFLGRVTEDKGFLVLLEALRRVREAGLDARLVAIGPVDPAVRRAVGTRRDVTLLGERTDPWRYFPAVDAFVLPSFHEGLPLSLLEAMASGLPAITTRVGDMPRLVRPGETGWLVAPKDAAGLAAAIGEAAVAESLGAMGGAALRLVREEYDFGTTVRAYEALYRELASR